MTENSNFRFDFIDLILDCDKGQCLFAGLIGNKYKTGSKTILTSYRLHFKLILSICLPGTGSKAEWRFLLIIFTFGRTVPPVTGTQKKNF